MTVKKLSFSEFQDLLDRSGWRAGWEKYAFVNFTPQTMEPDGDDGFSLLCYAFHVAQIDAFAVVREVRLFVDRQRCLIKKDGPLSLRFDGFSVDATDEMVIDELNSRPYFVIRRESPEAIVARAHASIHWPFRIGQSYIYGWTKPDCAFLLTADGIPNQVRRLAYDRLGKLVFEEKIDEKVN